MSDACLKVVRVSKSYSGQKTLGARLFSWIGLKSNDSSAYFAVKDISLSLYAGETVGIIGQNGAGKSTLLKLITGVTRPSSGSIRFNGRISAILELGVGFNPDFTGRENVRHSAGLMGFSPKKIELIIPKVIDFAELGEFFDEPLRVYSSGMQARLAFALATAERPDILIIDEVLSVGDSYFQHKSFERIKQFRKEGASIILVTHSMGDVKVLCDRVLLIGHGEVVKEGLPDEVVDYYNALTAEKENSKLSIEQRREKNGWLYTEFGNKMAEVKAIRLVNSETRDDVQLVRVGETVEVQTEILVIEPIEQLVLGHRISDRMGNIIWGTNTYHSKQVLYDLKSGQTIRASLKFPCDLGPGSYSVSFGVHKDDTHLSECYHKADNRIVFDVINADKPRFIGTSYLKSEFTIEQIT